MKILNTEIQDIVKQTLKRRKDDRPGPQANRNVSDGDKR